MLRITKSTGAYEYFDAPVSSSIEPEATMSPKIRIADYQPAIDKLNCWRSTLAIAGRVEGFKGQIAYVARVHDNGVEKVEVMRTQNTADGYGVDEVFYRDENGETRPGGNWNKCLISEVFPSPPTKAIFTDGHDEETSPVWFWFDDGTADLKPIEVESDCDCDWKAEGLSTRASNLLAKLEIHTVDALLERFPDFVDLMMIKGVGVKTADEIWGHIEAISRRRETAWLNSDNGDSNDSSGGSPPPPTSSPAKIADYAPELKTWRGNLIGQAVKPGFKGMMAYIARRDRDEIKEVKITAAFDLGKQGALFYTSQGDECLTEEIFPSPPKKVEFDDAYTGAGFRWEMQAPLSNRVRETAGLSNSNNSLSWPVSFRASLRNCHLPASAEAERYMTVCPENGESGGADMCWKIDKDDIIDFSDGIMMLASGWVSRRPAFQRAVRWNVFFSYLSFLALAEKGYGKGKPMQTLSNRARETAGLGILPLPYDSFHLRSFMVPSASRPGLLHHVNFYGSPDVACTCEYFQIRKRCRHIEAVKWNELHQAVPSSESGRSSKEVVAFHAKRTGAISKNGKMESYRINGKQCYWFEKRDILDHSGGCLTVPAWYLERHPALATEVR